MINRYLKKDILAKYAISIISVTIFIYLFIKYFDIPEVFDIISNTKNANILRSTFSVLQQIIFRKKIRTKNQNKKTEQKRQFFNICISFSIQKQMRKLIYDFKKNKKNSKVKGLRFSRAGNCKKIKNFYLIKKFINYGIITHLGMRSHLKYSSTLLHFPIAILSSVYPSLIPYHPHRRKILKPQELL